jgi:hypothetical protein
MRNYKRNIGYIYIEKVDESVSVGIDIESVISDQIYEDENWREEFVRIGEEMAALLYIGLEKYLKEK